MHRFTILKQVLFLFVVQFLNAGVALAQDHSTPGSSEQAFYFFRDQKIALQVSTSQIYYRTATATDAQTLRQRLLQQGLPASAFKAVNGETNGLLDLKLANKLPMFNAVLNFLANNKLVLLARPALLSKDDKITLYDEVFYVKLKKGIALSSLQSLIQNNNCLLAAKYAYNNDTYIIYATAANNYDGLKMANVFHDSNLFDYAEPDFTVPDMKASPPATDPLYNLQWGLKKFRYSGSI